MSCYPLPPSCKGSLELEVRQKWMWAVFNEHLLCENPWEPGEGTWHLFGVHIYFPHQGAGGECNGELSAASPLKQEAPGQGPPCTERSHPTANSGDPETAPGAGVGAVTCRSQSGSELNGKQCPREHPPSSSRVTWELDLPGMHIWGPTQALLRQPPGGGSRNLP